MTGIPVLLTESGIATDDDAERITYIAAVLRGVRRAIDDGVDIRGYFVWSLLDNFEWSHGFRPKFGLHSVDRKTFARRAKPSASWFGSLARAEQLVAITRLTVRLSLNIYRASLRFGGLAMGPREPAFLQFLDPD